MKYVHVREHVEGTDIQKGIENIENMWMKYKCIRGKRRDALHITENVEEINVHIREHIEEMHVHIREHVKRGMYIICCMWKGYKYTLRNS